MRPREQWIDILRGETVVLVVVFHSTGLLRYSTAVAPQPLVTFNDMSEPYWMPTFSFISGLLADRSMQKAAPEYYRGKAGDSLYPFAIWTAAYALVFDLPRTKEWALRLATGGSYLFFLPFQFGFYALSYPPRRVHPGIIAATSLMVSAVAPARWAKVPSRFTETFWHLYAMYSLGRWASRSPARFRALQQSPVAVASGAFASLLGGAASAGKMRVAYRWKWAWSPALALIPFAWSARAVEGTALGRVLGFVGQNSLVFYSAHYPVAYAAIKRSKSGRGRRTIAEGVIAALAVSTGLTVARRRSVFVARLFAP